MLLGINTVLQLCLCLTEHTEAILALHRLDWGLHTHKLGAPKNPHRLLCPAALVPNGAEGQDERQEL